MKCPHCQEDIIGPPCPTCGEATAFETANYCMACGTPLKEGLEEVAQRDSSDDDNGFDLDDRVLCPDGACTGIIIDGKCSECGRMVGEDGQFIEQEPAQDVETAPTQDDAETKKAD
jgi:DNA-directed RNA polymerase subunit N (RpoN/RPB10)